MKNLSFRKVLGLVILVFIFVAACNISGQGGSASPQVLATARPTNTEVVISPLAPTVTPQPTNTPEPPPTNTPEPVPTDTPEPTATEEAEECGDVNLTGRYVDYRTWSGILYGWIMDAEQQGCDFVGTEYWYVESMGQGSMEFYGSLVGTIEGDKVRVCYTECDYYPAGFCLNLVIFDGGQELANGIEGWQYEKISE